MGMDWWLDKSLSGLFNGSVIPWFYDPSAVATGGLLVSLFSRLAREREDNRFCPRLPSHCVSWKELCNRLVVFWIYFSHFLLPLKSTLIRQSLSLFLWTFFHNPNKLKENVIFVKFKWSYPSEGLNHEVTEKYSDCPITKQYILASSWQQKKCKATPS